MILYTTLVLMVSTDVNTYCRQYSSADALFKSAFLFIAFCGQHICLARPYESMYIGFESVQFQYVTKIETNERTNQPTNQQSNNATRHSAITLYAQRIHFIILNTLLGAYTRIAY